MKTPHAERINHTSHKQLANSSRCAQVATVSSNKNLLIVDLKVSPPSQKSDMFPGCLCLWQPDPCLFVCSCKSDLLLVFLLPDIQAGQGQRNQAKELGKTRPDVHNQQHRTVMMNGTYDVQVSTGQGQEIQIDVRGDGAQPFSFIHWNNMCTFEMTWSRQEKLYVTDITSKNVDPKQATRWFS